MNTITRTIMLLLFLIINATASLDFADGTTQVSNHGSSSDFDNMATGTVCAWVYPEAALSTNHSITAKRVDASNQNVLRQFGTSGDVDFIIARATTNLQIQSSNTPLTQNDWNFVAVTWDVNGADTDQKMFVGSSNTSISEITYAIQTAGSGTQGDDSSADMGIGNLAPAFGAAAFGGRIAVVAIWTTQLTEGQIRSLEFKPRKTANCVLLVHLGFNGTGTQVDWSGSGNHGTVTGATVDDHVPLGPTFGYEDNSSDNDHHDLVQPSIFTELRQHKRGINTIDGSVWLVQRFDRWALRRWFQHDPC